MLESLLVAEDGSLRPWSEFKKEAWKVSGDYNHRWLETEYHQTVANANAARMWKDFGRNTDLYPNVKFMSVRDGRVRLEHRALDGTVRPYNDPFWDTHLPPLDWGCRCTVVQTDEEPTEVKGGVQMKIEFENNPAVSGRIFSGSGYLTMGGLTPELIEKLTRESISFAQRMFKKVVNDGTRIITSVILKLPRKSQFFGLGKNLYQHILVDITKDDYLEILKVGRELTKIHNRVELMPEISIYERKARQLIFPNLLTKTSNPDLKGDGNYYDLKRPESIKKIVRNANKASAQGAIAIISTQHLDKKITEKILQNRANDILSEKNRKYYQFDSVFFYHNGRLIKFNKE